MEMQAQPLTIALAAQLRVLSKSSSCDALPKAVSVVLECNAALLTAQRHDEIAFIFAPFWGWICLPACTVSRSRLAVDALPR